MRDWKSYAQITMALFVLLDPIGAVPIFVTLTANHTSEERRRTIDLASVTAFVVLLIALLTGSSLLHILGISIASFTVGGGIVLMMMAIRHVACPADPDSAPGRSGR